MYQTKLKLFQQQAGSESFIPFHTFQSKLCTIKSFDTELYSEYGGPVNCQESEHKDKRCKFCRSSWAETWRRVWGPKIQESEHKDKGCKFWNIRLLLYM